LPVAPIISRGQITSTKIEVVWSSVASSSVYELEVSTNINFTPLLPSYPLEVSGSETNAFVENLSTSTQYRIRMRSKNGALYSNYSNSLLVSTLDGAGGDINLRFPPAAATVPLTYNVGSTSPQLLTVLTSGGIGAVNVYINHRKCSEILYTRETLTPTGNGTFTIPLNQDWFDQFGAQVYFEAEDQSGTPPIVLFSSNTGATPYLVTNKVNNFEIPISSFGRSQRNYQIVSIPHSLSSSPKIQD
jgi:hypothetical protein